LIGTDGLTRILVVVLSGKEVTMPSFFKFHQPLFDNWWARDAITLQIVCWILDHATYKAIVVPIKAGKGFSPVPLTRGQMIIGRNSVCKELGMPASIFRNRMKKLEKFGIITRKSTNRFTIVTVCNYDNYNGRFSESDQQATSEQPTDNQQTTTNKKNRRREISKEAREVLNYLNEVTGKRFHDIIENLYPIQERLDGGYKFDDMKAVIDRMTEQWKGTKYEQYLRPRTLFTQRNFDNYLNAAPVMNKPKIPIDDSKTGNVY